ncbi:UNVERIFIED_CONTAM: hypothetical protein Sindi_2970900 [Sesamum indicum]
MRSRGDARHDQWWLNAQLACCRAALGVVRSGITLDPKAPSASDRDPSNASEPGTAQLRIGALRLVPTVAGGRLSPNYNGGGGEELLQTTIRTAKPPDSQVGLFPVRSPLLGESLRWRLWVQRDARADDAERGTTARELSVQPPLVVTSVAAGSHLGRPRAGAHGRPMSAPHATGGGATRCVTPRQTCPGLMASGATCVQRLDGSRGFCNSHQVSHFATFFIDARAEISVAESRFDIRETSPPPRAPRGRGHRAADASFGFPWRVPRRGFVSPHVERVRARRRGRGPGRGRSPRARAPILFATCSRSASAGFDNDPSAGSPTETLLRLLLPLNDKVQWTSRDVAGSEPPTSPRSEHFTGPFNR